MFTYPIIIPCFTTLLLPSGQEYSRTKKKNEKLERKLVEGRINGVGLRSFEGCVWSL